MSYSYEQRKKMIRKFKRVYDEHWYGEFRLFVKRLQAEETGPPIGTLADLAGRIVP